MSKLRIAMFSGGESSWAAAKRSALEDGVEGLTLLFADTKEEDEDTYRFLHEAAANVGAPLVVVADGRNVWQTFRDTKFIGNTRVDVCSRALKRDVCDAWLDANCDRATTTVLLGYNAEEVDRARRGARRYAENGWAAESPLCRGKIISAGEVKAWCRREGIAEQRLYLEGFPHANCFSGETRFLTADGCKTLAEMAGKTCKVLGTNGAWRDAEVRSFGVQTLLRVTMTRFGQSKDVYATAGHRWFTWRGSHSTQRKELTTAELVPGTRLVSMFGNGLAPHIRLSAFGIAHGIVFGDGDRNDADNQRFTNPARLTLCGDKKAPLLRYFPLSPTAEVPGVGIQARDLPRHFKDRPRLDESKSYLAGWLAGYLAADGCVQQSGEVSLSCAKLDDLLFVRDVCVRLGVGTLRPRKAMRSGFGAPPSALYTLPFIRSTMREDLFLIEEHQRRFAANSECKKITNVWKVESVAPSGRTEEVFCAVVPEGHAFTLEDNVLTSNCGGACVKAGQAHWRHLLAVRPDTYRKWEEQEEAFRRDFGKDVAILRDRRGGVTRGMPLKVFRERIEKDAKACDETDWGGCGCFSAE